MFFFFLNFMFRAVSGFTVKLRGSYKDLSIDPLSPFPCCCCCCQVASVVSDSVRPHRQQTTGLLCPWDPPGKNTGEGNGKPLQYSCLENPMNSMKKQKDTTQRDELPRSVGAQYATGDQWRNNSRKNEETEPK